MRKAFQVPTTDDARARYTVGRDEMDGAWDIDSEAEFDRWLAQVKAEARVEALEDLATAHYLDGPQSAYDTIMRYADRIAREAGIETGGHR